MIRRDFLKAIGAAAAGAAVGLPAAAAGSGSAAAREYIDSIQPGGSLNDLTLPIRSLKPVVDRQISIVVIGAGSRGNVYARYAEAWPDAVKVVGVSDILEHRCRKMADKHGVDAEHRFGDWSEVFKVPKFADAVVISTPDDVHYEPCMKALSMGYDVLLEKPVAQTEKECKAILAQAHKYGACSIWSPSSTPIWPIPMCAATGAVPARPRPSSSPSPATTWTSCAGS